MSVEPVSIAILVYPETTSAVVYGMYDIFCSAGRDWELITEGHAGTPRIRPLLVSRRGEPLSISNNISVRPDTSLADCPPVRFIVVPEVNLPPGTKRKRFGALRRTLISPEVAPPRPRGCFRGDSLSAESLAARATIVKWCRR